VGRCQAGQGRAVGSRVRAGRGRGRAGPGRAAGKRCWVGRGRRPARAAGRGAVGVERGQARRPARTARRGRAAGAWPGKAQPRQVGPVSGVRCRSRTGGQCATEARRGQVGVGRGATSQVRSGQSRGGRHLGSREWVARVAGPWGVGCGAQKSGEE
jgi:hypothetical protein